MTTKADKKSISYSLVVSPEISPEIKLTAKGGFSMSTAYRIDQGKHQPQKGQPRDWRTRRKAKEAAQKTQSGQPTAGAKRSP